jgi:hypothetical protein
MGALRFLALGFAVCMALASDVVEADELVIPYTCTMDRGAPRLSPSDTETYRIIGPREDQPFQACASSAAWTCETMMVHKFTVECAGQRVSWARVAASARALGVAIPDRLPAGFAPVSRLSGRFILPGFGKPAAISRVTSETLSRDAIIEPAAVETAAKQPTWVTVVDPVAAPGSSGNALKVAGVISTLLASLLAACLLFVRRRQFPAFEFSTGQIGTASAGGRMRDLASAMASTFRRHVENWRYGTSDIADDPNISEALAPVREKLNDTEAAVLMLPSDLLLRDVLISELDGVRQRAVELELRSRKLESERIRSVIRAAIRDLDRIGRIARGARPVAEDSYAPTPEPEVPSTMFEAYRILGLNPDAPEVAVKKIVDALRMSWHPDHARDEADRRHRNQRIKQVNAAWDLLRTRRAEAA